jgi:hypothetical protein
VIPPDNHMIEDVWSKHARAARHRPEVYQSKLA